MIFKEYINILSNIILFDEETYKDQLESIFNQIMTAVFSNGLDKHIPIIGKALYMLCVKYKIDVDFIPEEIITYFIALYINEHEIVDNNDDFQCLELIIMSYFVHINDSSARSMCQDYGYQLIQIAHNFSMHINMNYEYEIFILFTHRIELFLKYLDDCSDYLGDFLETAHYIIDEGELDDNLRQVLEVFIETMERI